MEKYQVDSLDSKILSYIDSNFLSLSLKTVYKKRTNGIGLESLSCSKIDYILNVKRLVVVVISRLRHINLIFTRLFKNSTCSSSSMRHMVVMFISGTQESVYQTLCLHRTSLM